MAELLRLIDEVDTIEMKNKLAACLSTIIDRSRAEVLFTWSIDAFSLTAYQIAPSMSLIISAFPQLCKFTLLIVSC